MDDRNDFRLDLLHPRKPRPAPPPDHIAIVQFMCVQGHTFPVSFHAPPSARQLTSQVCPDCGLPGHWYIIDSHIERRPH